LSEGRGESVEGLRRVEAPPGEHVIDHVTRTWMATAKRPLVKRPDTLEA
jgi:hypothetical protein